MSSAAVVPLTRSAVFEPLVAIAKARVVTLLEQGKLTVEDGEFLLRALLDLDADGSELFGAAGPADAAFYADVADYLVARVGAVAVEARVLAPTSAELVAELAAREGTQVSHLLGLDRYGRNLERMVIDLVSHQGGCA